MNKYLATVSINGQSIKTIVFANSPTHARLLIQYQFGMNSIKSMPIKTEAVTNSYVILNELVANNKPLTPQQARIKSLQMQKANVSKQLKAERDKQKIVKAQQQIQSLRSLKNIS